MIRYIKGDATMPVDRPAIIVHICNDVGRWGSGFVMALSQRWKRPEAAYRQWHKEGFLDETFFSLGEIQMICVDTDLWVANMIAQSGTRSKRNKKPLRLDALRTCLEKVAEKAKELDASVHMPRIGCDRAGGTWKEVGPIVEETLVELPVVTIYDFKEKNGK